ncbi:MAG: selenide, water dikinase SelD [Pseudomonadota bacterium]
MKTLVRLVKDVVLVGGGHTHALFLRKWGMSPVAGVRLTIVDPGAVAAYSGMLPGFVAGHYDREDLDIDLVRLARFAGARLVRGRACGLDLAAARVHVNGRPPIRFDHISFDVGITSTMPSLPGFDEFATPAKPLGIFADRWSAFRAAVADGRVAPRVAIIGGGVAGVELAMAMAHALRSQRSEPEVSVIEAADIADGPSSGARTRLRSELYAQGVAARLGKAVTGVTAEGVVLEDGKTVAADFVIGAAGAQPYPWLAKTGLHLTDGFIDVDAQLRSPRDPRVFAVGDCAHMLAHPRPKAGVYAVRQAPVLFHNIRADLLGQQRRDYRPQSDYLKLISLGEKKALADKAGMAFSGPALWRLKDRIDRGFMEKLTDLRPMTAETKGDLVSAKDTAAPPLCAGCGAKVAPRALGAGLGNGDEPALGDDAAVLRVGTENRVISTDHLRGFVEDPYTVARIAAVHAMGDIWAMGAVPESALANIILPDMDEALQEATLNEIMAAARAEFAPVGARIVGGHTTLGAELTIGFTVIGTPVDDPIGLAGARPGDVLILTKPIGSGTILAADMALKAPGGDVIAALEAMAQPQGAASKILAVAHAMTDVTGFGLFGHLWNLLSASGVAADIDLEAVPVLSGALELASKGVRSSLYAANRRYTPAEVPETPLAALCFDPQTAGGLLAAVDPAGAQAVWRQLQEAGFTACSIGALRPGPPAINLV